MLKEVKNLDELFFFAQNILKEVEEKKKELEEPLSEKGSTTLGLSSFKESRERALRYRTWKQRLCDTSNRSDLAKSMDRLKDLESNWNNQKKEYTNPSLSSSFCQSLVQRQSVLRNNQWDIDPHNDKDQDNQNGSVRSSNARALSQESVPKRSLLEENTSARDGKSGRPGKLSLTGSFKSFKPVKFSPLFDSESSIQKKEVPVYTSEQILITQETNPPTFTNLSCMDTPKEKPGKGVSHISPLRKEFLKRNFIETQQSNYQTNPVKSITQTPISVSTYQPKTTSLTTTTKNKVSSRKDSVNSTNELRDERRGRNSSISEKTSFKPQKDKVGSPYRTTVNISEQIRSSFASNPGENVQVKIKFLAQGKIIETEMVSAKASKKQSFKASALKNLFPPETKTIAKPLPLQSTQSGEMSPRQPAKALRTSLAHILQETKPIDSESTKNGYDSSTGASLASSQFKTKNETETESEVVKIGNSSRSRNLRSASCNPRQTLGVRREVSQSPVGLGSRVPTPQIADVKREKKPVSVVAKPKLKKDPSAPKKLPIETKKKTTNDLKTNPLKLEKDKLVRDILLKLHAKKQNNAIKYK